jgi:glycosyltransferase involved in cell wall biosynthesis
MRYGYLWRNPSAPSRERHPRMRICIVMEYHPVDLTGGSETQVFGLAREFAKAGHEVTYVCQRYDRARPVAETVDGVRILRTLRWRKVFRFLAAGQLFRTVRRLRPEIVYQRFASPITGLSAMAARSLSVPFVWGCSEDRSLERGSLLHRHDGASGGPMRFTKAGVLSLNAWINQHLFYHGLRRAQAVVVQNGSQLEALETHYGLLGTLIPNGVAVPPARGSASPTPLVLWLNRIAPRKNPEAFIDLARSMQAAYPAVRFVLVGGRQDDAYMESIRQRAAGVGNLELTGNVAPAEVQRWLEQAWVFMLTSTAEGFPNVLLQAWAAGTPVVSLEIDPDGLIAREGLGLISGTSDGLQRDVARLLDDAGLRERLARVSGEYVAEHFEFAKIAERYLALFQELIAAR